jgi:ABC-type Zn uptake system ZnuABC Zn-binding protein ZnuA
MRVRAGLCCGIVVTATLVGACSDSNGGVADARGCAEASAVGRGPIRVVTTVAPITSIVAMITSGASAEVEGIVPEGVNSHTYEPTPGVAASLERADVIFLNGLDLEAPTKSLALANIGDGAVVCELGDAILPESGYIYDFSFPESAGSPNPHLWTNPPMVRVYAATIRDVMVAVDPGDADLYRANFDAFATRVDALDAAVRTASESIPRAERLLLTYHDAYAYFAAEYGWTIVGAVQPSSFNEPTPREVAALIDQIRSSGVAAIFGSEVFPSPVLRQIAAETGAEYVDDLRDDDLPGDPGDDRHSWLGLMQLNVVTIVAALGGDAIAVETFDPTPPSKDVATYAQ